DAVAEPLERAHERREDGRLDDGERMRPAALEVRGEDREVGARRPEREEDAVLAHATPPRDDLAERARAVGAEVIPRELGRAELDAELAQLVARERGHVRPGERPRRLAGVRLRPSDVFGFGEQGQSTRCPLLASTHWIAWRET